MANQNHSRKFELLLERMSSELDVASLLDEKRGPLSISYLNPFSFIHVREEDLASLDYVFIDGISMVWSINLLFGTCLRRGSFDFTSHASSVFLECNKLRAKVAIVASTQDELCSSLEFLNERYNDIDFTLSRNGYFESDIERDTYIKTLSEADIVVCGMGTPLQESFLRRAKELLVNDVIMFTCGGFISQISGKTEYFHPVFDYLNLRWLQRMLTTSYVWKRILNEYPRFLLCLLAYRLKKV